MPERFYPVFFGILAAVCFAGESQSLIRGTKSKQEAQPEAFRRFCRNYLIVYSLAMGALTTLFATVQRST